MSTHNTCLYKEVDTKYTGCNLKTMDRLDCALTGICAVVWLNTVQRGKVGIRLHTSPSVLGSLTPYILL